MADTRPIVNEPPDRHAQSFAEELGIDVVKQTPSAVFELLDQDEILTAAGL